MTPQQASLLRPIYEAYAEGRVVQWRSAGTSVVVWMDYCPSSLYAPMFLSDRWQGAPVEWRIKPLPTPPREVWWCPECNFTGRYAVLDALPGPRPHCLCTGMPDLVLMREVAP